ncbi:MAG: aminotransferase class V-fold PLP-dependent enzyme [Isosphaeraceae bacterium]
MQPIYLDYNATTPTDLHVVEAMRRYSRVDFGNASSLHHSHGRAAKQAIDKARRKVAALLSAKPDEILFTSGATVTSAAIRWISRRARPTTRSTRASTSGRAATAGTR